MKSLLSRQHLSLLATLVIACILWFGASLRYTGFATPTVFINLFDDNAFLGIAAVGMTFVILSGGIDLSVGAMIGASSIGAALLIEKLHWHPGAVAPVVVVLGGLFGALMGTLIAVFELAPFLVTLAGMFLLRGFAYTLSLDSVPLTHPSLTVLAGMRLPLGEVSVPPMALVFLAIVALGCYIGAWTRFGRSVYAFGGNAFSARLMGLPVVRTQILIYTLSGALAALAGLVFTFYTFSGNATAATGLELDAIAAVVVGGTLLSGGRGAVFGTLVGTLILGMIQTIITFESTLSSWWTKIVIGGLLFVFVILQRALEHLSRKGATRFHPHPSKAKTKNDNGVQAKLSGAAVGWLGATLLGALLFSAPSASLARTTYPGAEAFTEPTQTVCPRGQFPGRKIENGLYQLTGTYLKQGQTTHPIPELPDPAPPYVNARGQVEIYGSAKYFIRYQSWKEFSEGGCYQVVRLDVLNPNGAPYTAIYTHPWDIRKFRVDSPGEQSREILIGGAMSATHGRKAPVWPDDNWNRRIFFFRQQSGRGWLRDLTAIIGDVTSGWLGHSYGGNLMQENQRNPNVIREDSRYAIAFFYEKVTEVRNNGPFKTEIFATKMDRFDRVSNEGEVKIMGVGDRPFPSTVRTVGGFLIEGPRPFQVNLNGRRFYIVGFSSGDFPTDKYTINYMWSRSLMGPYKPVVTADGRDLEDLGRAIKTHYGLSWVGRPSFYQAPSGGYEMLFHGVIKDILPDNDYQHWPQKYKLWEFYRCLFKAQISFHLGSDGGPVIRVDTALHDSLRNRPEAIRRERRN